MRFLKPDACSRRRFVQTIAAFGSVGLLGKGHAAGAPAQINLSIGQLPLRVAGRACMATAVNGSVPGPVVRLREGDDAVIQVTNQLSEPTSIHWHGLRLPSDQDGVPGLSFRGIEPGATFTYRFPVRQSGTYWYHSHSGMQEQTGVYGAVIIDPRVPDRSGYDREHVLLLSDWTCDDPMKVFANLKQESDYYNQRRSTAATFAQRLMWERMRMDRADIADVSGAAYTFLANGQTPAANTRLLFQPGERVRLRIINGSSMTTFDVRIPGLSLQIVAADGHEVTPVSVDEFRIGVAETYDLIVAPQAQRAYTIFAQAQDRSGYARATLAANATASADIPPMDPRPLRSMADMSTMPGMKMPAVNMPGMSADSMVPSRLAEAGDGLENNGRRVLTYADLQAATQVEQILPTRDITLHLTGNMERYVWGFDGEKFSQAQPIAVRLGERVRFVLINDTMMEHPIHLHGFFFALENGQDRLPLKHTINVKPASRVSFLVHADTPGHWAFHCHLLFHMEAGMFRTVVVA
ncbi:MAG TPA: copper resistance system multicopper oxidase [Steroidobacteraceae bacterium]|jgi:CopA family copper-resistance protein